MIIVDYGNVSVSSLFAALGAFTNTEVTIDGLRHLILNSLRTIKVKFGREYGEMVIACDSRNSWRRNLFPYYKANRRKAREESELNWTEIHEFMATIRDEIRDNFSYRVVHVDGAEADDIIGTLVINSKEKNIILSADHDMIQLHRYPNVYQYDPINKKTISHPDPERQLFDKIVKGDSGDGVPNILSPDNCLVVKTRQKPVFKKKLDEWYGQEPEAFCDPTMLRGYYRNKALIDLRETPLNIQEEILEQFQEEENKDPGNLMKYFMAHRLRNLLESMAEF